MEFTNDLIVFVHMIKVNVLPEENFTVFVLYRYCMYMYNVRVVTYNKTLLK